MRFKKWLLQQEGINPIKSMSMTPGSPNPLTPKPTASLQAAGTFATNALKKPSFATQLGKLEAEPVTQQNVDLDKMSAAVLKDAGPSAKTTNPADVRAALQNNVAANSNTNRM